MSHCQCVISNRVFESMVSFQKILVWFRSYCKMLKKTRKCHEIKRLRNHTYHWPYFSLLSLAIKTKIRGMFFGWCSRPRTLFNVYQTELVHLILIWPVFLWRYNSYKRHDLLSLNLVHDHHLPWGLRIFSDFTNCKFQGHLRTIHNSLMVKKYMSA